MKVIRSIQDIPQIKNAVVTNGTFDGTHVGHQKILEQLVNSAKRIDGESVVITYWPHPRLVLGKETDNFKLLYTIEERIELLKAYPIDYLIILEFTKEFAEQSSETFIRSILMDKIGTKKLIIGYNHRFGKNREGGFDYLKENASIFGFEIEEISKQVIDDEGISSTKIRKALLRGDVDTANNYLDKKFFLFGKVVHGKKLGRTIGFPTANLEVNSKNKIIPEDGVYAVLVEREGSPEQFKGMMNIGYKPTVESNKEFKTVEVHIFDFDKDLYGEILKVEFVFRIRAEKKFESVEALQKQLEYDKSLCL